MAEPEPIFINVRDERSLQVKVVSSTCFRNAVMGA